MPYTAEISRANPAMFLFMIDQSASMEDPIGQADAQARTRKCDVVADALNRLLSELTYRCAKEEGVRDYFHVAVIGYGGQVRSALGGVLASRDLVPISEIAEGHARLEERTKKVPDGVGGLVEQTVKFPVWLDPVTENGTPMSQAFAQAQAVTDQWLHDHPNSFPPVVLNLTDGESTDGDPRQPAAAIRALASTDGNVLLFNLHVSSDRSAPTTFPSSGQELPDDYARLLFEMSSVLPERLHAYARQQGFSVASGSRGFVFNADTTAIVQFLDIGTRATELR